MTDVIVDLKGGLYQALRKITMLFLLRIISTITNMTRDIARKSPLETSGQKIERALKKSSECLQI